MKTTTEVLEAAAVKVAAELGITVVDARGLMRFDRRSAAARFYRSVRFHLFWCEALWDKPERWRDFCGHAWSAFYLLDEAEAHRFGGRYRR